MNIFYFLFCIVLVKSDIYKQIKLAPNFTIPNTRRVFSDTLKQIELAANFSIPNTRRILSGRVVGDTRPYMVYLRPANDADPKITQSNWLCGGVIIHEHYILTSAACIEDAKHFYVISGTNRWLPITETDDECIKYGAKKAVWKCVPKTYFFDGNEFDNIRWMVKDIAVVKVEDDFNFERRVKGCDFIPKMIAYNSNNPDLEKPGTKASVAGWGSIDTFSEPPGRSYANSPGALRTGDTNDLYIGKAARNSPDLLEADVVIIPKDTCKRGWDARYHHIIDEEMICTKDSQDTESMSTLCIEQEVECKELLYDEDEDKTARRQMVVNAGEFQVRGPIYIKEIKRIKGLAGGFCENDHGGPLIVGPGKSAVVVGVISASLTRNTTRQCYGPYLYTSVYKNRHLISCAIDKEMGITCRRLLRSTKTRIVETFFNWTDHKDGPAKGDHSTSKFSKINFSPGGRPIFRVTSADSEFESE